MNIHELHTRDRRRGKHRPRDCVGDVVEFQVEKNVRSQLRHLADGFGPRRSKELAANLEHADKIRHLLGELQRRG